MFQKLLIWIVGTKFCWPPSPLYTCTPVIVNAANGNLPVHFINHSDRDVVVPKHTYVEAMEKVQESDLDNLSTNATREPVSEHA